MAKKAEYVTKNEAADILGVSTRTIDRLVERGVLVRYSRTIGRNTALFRREDIERLRDEPPSPEE